MTVIEDKAFCEAAYALGILSFAQILDLLFEPQRAQPDPLAKRCYERKLLTSCQIEAIEHYLEVHAPRQLLRAECVEADPDAPDPDDSLTLKWQEGEATGRGVERDEGCYVQLSEQVGRYLEQKEVGRGGMGIVYCVQDAAMNRRVALKELLPDISVDESMSQYLPDLQRRFVREAELTAALQHPGIVPVYEIGRREASGEAYYTMKMVEGRTMAEVIKTATGLEDRLALLPNFIDVCQTLAYAHRQGVVHRDLKPTNIIIGEFGETYVLDWGLALFIDSSPTQRDDAPKMPSYSRSEASGSLTEKGVGTPHYMSPEQALGSTEEIDERSDIYSLGAVLFEILTGQKNTFDYNFGTLEALVSEKEENSPATNLALSLPAELVAICKRAMAPDKSHRFQDARDLAVAIQKVQTGAEIVLEQLAEAVHIAYMKERKAQGWRHGPVRDDARKENPTLIPYNELSEEEKDLDRVTARQTIQALRQLGFIVARERRPFPI